MILPLSFFFPPGDQPGGGGGTVADLIGTWQFTVGSGNNPDILVYVFNQLQNNGQMAVGKQPGSGDDIVASASGDQFVMFDRQDVSCLKYTFQFTGPDRLEGTQTRTLRVPFSNDCDTFTVGGSQAFFADRTG